MRRFKWDDHETVYLPVEEDCLERTPEHMVRFTAVSVDGSQFAGAAYDSTVADMVDAKPYWKLAPNPNRPGKSVVVAVAGVPLKGSAKTKRQASMASMYIRSL